MYVAFANAIYRSATTVAHLRLDFCVLPLKRKPAVSVRKTLQKKLL